MTSHATGGIITVSVPYYGTEFRVNLLDFAGRTVQEVEPEFIRRAIMMADLEVDRPIFHPETTTPRFVMLVLGRYDEPLEEESVLNTVLEIGDNVIMLTEAEFQASGYWTPSQAPAPLSLLSESMVDAIMWTGSAGLVGDPMYASRDRNLFQASGLTSHLSRPEPGQFGATTDRAPVRPAVPLTTTGRRGLAQTPDRSRSVRRPVRSNYWLRERLDSLYAHPPEHDIEMDVLEFRRDLLTGGSFATLISGERFMEALISRVRRAVATEAGSVDGFRYGDDVKSVLDRPVFERLCKIVETPIRTVEEKLVEISPEESETVGGPNDSGLGACAICQCLLRVNIGESRGILRKMPACEHVFHSECLSRWLTTEAITCPVCRVPATQKKNEYGYAGMRGTFTRADQLETYGMTES